MVHRRRAVGWGGRWLAAAVVLAGCVLAGCATGPSQAEQAAAARLGEPVERIDATIAYLASPELEGRGAGTKGLDEARDYILRCFQVIGLQAGFSPPADASGAGGGVAQASRSFTQPLDIKLTAEGRREELALVDAQGHLQRTLVPGGDFNALGLSASGTFTGEAVFVGYGITKRGAAGPGQGIAVGPGAGAEISASTLAQYDSYRGPAAGSPADSPPDLIRGKVAIAFRYEPRDEAGRSLLAEPDVFPSSTLGTAYSSLALKASAAAAHGAVALLIVDPPSPAPTGTLLTATQTLKESSASIPVLHLSIDTFGRICALAGKDGSDAAQRQLQGRADRGEDRPESLAGVTLRGSVEMSYRNARVENIAGVLPGRGSLAGQVVVVGAHYDHLGRGGFGSFATAAGRQVHPGADDNASGVAGLLELAMGLAQKGDAEAPGTESATKGDGTPATPTPRRTLIFVAFSGEERGLLGSAYLVAHLEELGIERKKIAAMVNLDMVGRMREERLYAMGSQTAEEWGPWVRDAARDSGLDVQLRGSALTSSDQASFARLGVPVLLFTTGLHEDYHRPSDTADKINALGEARALEVVERLVERLVTDPGRPKFRAE